MLNFNNRLTLSLQFSASKNSIMLLRDVASNTSPTSIPEPSTLAIFALGMMGLVTRRFKKKS